VTREQREVDERHMARCLELALRYKGRTAPNPIVGCVIVNAAGDVIAEGAHRGAGQAHAEIDALDKLGGKAHGSTMYVSLEPCNHHGRTPPCAPAVRASEVSRVVVGTEDPVEGHGGGIELLRRAQIAVSVGVLRDACERANRPWLTFVEKKRPAFVLKAAITLDGKICTVSGQSKWITGEAARADVHRLRTENEAVMVGIGTVLEDNPHLTSRIANGRDPVRVVLDSKLRTPTDAHLLRKNRDTGGPRVIIACADDAAASREKALVAKGAEVWRCKTHRNGRIDMHPLAQRLAEQEIMGVLVEGGGEVHAYLLQQRLCDQLVLYVAPKIVGGPAKSWVGGKGLRSMASAIQLVYEEEPVMLPGGDLRLTATLVPIPERPSFEIPDDD